MPSALTAPLALFNLGPTELIIILVIILLLFGGKRLPELAKGLGKSIREFKKASNEAEDQIRTAIDEDTAKNQTPAPKQTPPAATEKTSNPGQN